MEQTISLLSYLFVGFIEMFLVTQRTAFISKNKRKAAASVVLIENIITFFVILQLAQNVTQNIPSFAAYCIGSCSGTILDIENFTFDKIKRKVRKIVKKNIKSYKIEPQVNSSEA